MHILLITGIFYRFVLLDGPSLWLDEGTSLRISRSIPSALADRNGAAYYLLLHFWRQVAPLTEVWIRGLSALLDCLSILLFVRLCGFFCRGEKQKFAAVALYILLPSHVLQAANTRMYAMWGVLNLLILVTLVELARARKTTDNFRRLLGELRNFSIFVILFWVSMETHRYTAIFSFGYIVFAFQLSRRESDSRAALVAAIITVLALSLFRLSPDASSAIHYAIQRAQPIGEDFGPLLPLAAFVFDPRFNYFNPHPWWHLLGGSAVVGLFLIGVRNMWIADRRVQAICLSSFFLCVIAVTYLPLRTYPRLLHPFGFAFCLALACGLVDAGKSNVTISRTLHGIVACLAGIFLCTGAYYKFYAPQNFRAAISELKKERQADTLVLIVPEYAEPTVSFYSGQEHLHVGFPVKSSGFTAASAPELFPAFEYVETAYLISHQPEDYAEVVPELSKSHERIWRSEIGEVRIERYRRRTTVAATAKQQVCSRWPEACKNHPQWRSQ